MSPNQVPNDGSSSAELSRDVPTLQAQQQALAMQLEAVVATVRRLMAEEDPGAGKFLHKEIFQAQQEKLRLQTEIDLRARKIWRIELGME